MAYTFNKEIAATFRLPAGATTEGKALNLAGINSETESADTIVAGIQGLMYIANRNNKYNWGHGIRTVKEDVEYDE